MRITFLFLLSFMLFSCKTNQKIEENNSKSINNLIIYYKSPSYLGNLKKEITNYGAEIVYLYLNINTIVIKIPENKSIDKAKRYFSKQKGVSEVEKNTIMHLDEKNIIY